MARKTKKELAKREETIRTVWLIVSLLVTVLIFFTVSKMGTLGIFFNNLLSYLFGSLYIVPLLSVFAYGIYAVFFKKKYPKSAKTVSGLFVLNAFVILLNAYILAQTVNFVQLGEYLKATFALIASNEAITMTGGLFGNFLYVIFTSLLTRTGTLIIDILLFIIAAILIVPAQVYRNLFNDVKDFSSEKHEEVKRHMEEFSETNGCLNPGVIAAFQYRV